MNSTLLPWPQPAFLSIGGGWETGRPVGVTSVSYRGLEEHHARLAAGVVTGRRLHPANFPLAPTPLVTHHVANLGPTLLPCPVMVHVIAGGRLVAVEPYDLSQAAFN